MHVVDKMILVEFKRVYLSWSHFSTIIYNLAMRSKHDEVMNYLRKKYPFVYWRVFTEFERFDSLVKEQKSSIGMRSLTLLNVFLTLLEIKDNDCLITWYLPYFLIFPVVRPSRKSFGWQNSSGHKRQIFMDKYQASIF